VWQILVLVAISRELGLQVESLIEGESEISAHSANFQEFNLIYLWFLRHFLLKFYNILDSSAQKLTNFF
jgi:hypothetical protein